jgi:lipopolysaccharide biosynthesis regulator YciM
MFDFNMYYYIIGVALVLLLITLFSLQVRRRARERNKDTSLYVSALQSLLEGDQVAAFHKLKDVVAQDTRNIDAYLRLGRILADRGKAKQAIQVHSDLLMRADITPAQRVAVQHHLIDDYAADNQLDKAISLLQKSFDRDPTNLKSGVQLLDLLGKTEKWEDAEAVAERLFKRDPTLFRNRLADVKIRLADIMDQRGKGRKARTLYKTAFHLDPTRYDVWVKVGDSYISEERVEDAVKAWMTLIEKDPEDAHLVFDRLRRSLFDLGQFNMISSVFEGILERDPNNISAAMALAELYEKKGDRSQALDYYRQIINAHPGYAPAHIGIARIYRGQGRINEAFEILENLYFNQEAARQRR